MADLLVIIPADDQAAQLSGLVGGRILRWIQYGAHGVVRRTVKDLVGSANANRANVDNELRNGHGHLFYFGHGDAAALIANGRALVDGRNITSLPPSAIVVAVACNSRSGLGVLSTGRGAVTAYLGWEDELPIPNVFPDPMIDALSDGLLPLLRGGDLNATMTELRTRFLQAFRDYQAWQPPATARQGAALYAKMAAMYASACLDIEGMRTATL